MTPQDRTRISIATARYLEAFECDDHATLLALWDLAANDPELIAAFQEIHASLIEEQAQAEQTRITQTVTTAVEEHLTGAEIVAPTTGPTTMADVADELFRNTPDRLPAAAHALNERLRSARDPLPDQMGLSKFIAWAEARFGPAPEAYWKAFREVALKLELRRSVESDYQLAARRAPKPEDGKP